MLHPAAPANQAYTVTAPKEARDHRAEYVLSRWARCVLSYLAKTSVLGEGVAWNEMSLKPASASQSW